MRLVYPEYGLDVVFRENKIMVMYIESPTAFSKILTDLWNQVNGGEGGFILSEQDKVYTISKKVDVIINPFSLNCNDRKIITKLYQEINGVAMEDFYEKTCELNGNIVAYLDELTNRLPYHLNFNLEIDLISILKSYNMGIDETADSLLERFIEYLRAMHQICGINTFTAVNLKQYFEQKELQNLYEFVFYEKVNFLMLEGAFSKQYENENCLILDKDLCIIEV